MGVQGRAVNRQLQQIAEGGRPSQHQGASDGFDVSLTSGSLSGEELLLSDQQTYEIEEIRHHHHHQQVHHHQAAKQQQQQLHSRDCSRNKRQYPSSCSDEGDIPTADLSSRPHHHHHTPFMGQIDETPDQGKQMRIKPAPSNQQQQKHRQLQARVHQQLQRIYGDQSNHHQQQLIYKSHKQMTQQHLDSQDDQFSSHESTNNILRPFDNNNNNNQHASSLSSSEQTYDSLSPPNFPPRPITIRPKQQNYFMHNRSRQVAPIISSIPEEGSGENATSTKNLLLSSDCLSDDNQHQLLLYHQQQQQQQQKQQQQQRQQQQIRSNAEDARKIPEVVSRKSQLESLHYATVTAAALLSATANAAAAIAATTNQQQLHQQKTLAHESTNLEYQKEEDENMDTKYSHPYQEVNPRKPTTSHDCCHRHDRDRHLQVQNMRCTHQQQQQHQHTRFSQRKLHTETGGPPPVPIAYQSVLPSLKGHHRLGTHHLHPHLYQHQHQQQVHRPQQQQHHQRQQVMEQQQAKLMQYHQALMNRPIPPHPPATRGSQPAMMMMMPNPGGVIRHQDPSCFIGQPQGGPYQGQLVQRPIPPMPTALAVVHAGPPSKAASARADLVGRMLISNLVAAHRMAAATANEPHYNYDILKGQLRGARPQLPQPSKANQTAYRLMAATAAPAASHQVREKAIYSTNAGKPASFDTGAGAGAVAGGCVGRAASNSSGHSSAAPLVINRDLAPLSFVERLCRIDLTLFWWSLLMISLLFIGIILTVSRYVL